MRALINLVKKYEVGFMTSALKNFRKAVRKAIQENHARGLPAYQQEGEYIIALYPDGKKVKLEKVMPFNLEDKFWQLLK